MSSKSISTGTLSLRFMQNARYAERLKEDELDRAKVEDDGMWQVSQAVKDAWGLRRDSDSSSNVHESSYLPFIFSAKGSVSVDDSAPEASPRKIAGRRTFNNKGEEVSQSTSTPDVPQVSSSTGTPEASSKRKIHPRPISISASGTSGQLKGFERLHTNDSKTARQSIFESGGVGTDLRASSRRNDVASTSAFMKPAGVDEPKIIRTALSSVPSPTSRSIIESARRKQIKREREREPNGLNDSRKKLKKRTSE